MLDYLIKGGTLVDGTGAKRRPGNIGIKDGRITAIGNVDEPAKETIDAKGKIVSPGFVDVHTHYDAQVFWDPNISPSSYHGVTSCFAGNCGFSVAPLSPETGDYLMRMLAKVEGMPLEALASGVPWDWDSFGSYLDKLDGKTAINIGFLVGHSAIRRMVMGEDTDKPASAEQLAQMKDLLKKSMAEGGMGFSSSQAATHNDGDGMPVPSRAATPEELIELAGCLREYPGTLLEFIPPIGTSGEERAKLMTDMSLAAQRSLNWNVLIVSKGGQKMIDAQLMASDYAEERGAVIKALTFAQPVSLRVNLLSGFAMDSFPGWSKVLALPLEERKKAFSDPEIRKTLVAGASHEKIPAPLRATGNFERMLVEQTFSESNKLYEGRMISDLTKELGKSASDIFFDIAVADDLRTTFLPSLGGHDDESWALRGKVFKDPRTLVGASDAGAHLDMIDTFAFSTTLLSEGVRQHKLLTLEEGIYEITEKPARFLGLKQRGRLEEGWFADIVVFDENTVGKGPIHTRNDLPQGAGRLYCEALGIQNVFVNGQEIVNNNELTGTKAGIVMRSGRDTETVLIPAAK
ncbi:MAG: amidohydrolase family protein [Pseudomonadales bacterium]|nr:amidohydrolase family protein [Pseudomonadales bacterium]